MSQEKRRLSWAQIEKYVEDIAEQAKLAGGIEKVAGVPRGGLIVATMLSHRLDLPVVRIEDADASTLIVDDICDTGATFKRFAAFKTAAVVAKEQADPAPAFYGCMYENDVWIVFPWETETDTVSSQSKEGVASHVRIAKAVGEIISASGDDMGRDGLKDTPNRVAKAWLEWLRGYRLPDFKVKRFATAYGGLVVRKGIPFQSFCEHHMARYAGTVDVAYIPNGWAVGLSKIIRLVQWKASRLTIQEDLTDEFAMMLCGELQTPDVAIVVNALHSCESTRGVRVGGVPTITSKLCGRFFDDEKLRGEFFTLTG